MLKTTPGNFSEKLKKFLKQNKERNIPSFYRETLFRAPFLSYSINTSKKKNWLWLWQKTKIDWLSKRFLKKSVIKFFKNTKSQFTVLLYSFSTFGQLKRLLLVTTAIWISCIFITTLWLPSLKAISSSSSPWDSQEIYSLIQNSWR